MTVAQRFDNKHWHRIENCSIRFSQSISFSWSNNSNWTFAFAMRDYHSARPLAYTIHPESMMNW